ncbi:hypothetical protein LZ155_09395, partial [Streptococcus agalactiae]|nr:hypothetical protein [Streptococcus agalactiae]
FLDIIFLLSHFITAVGKVTTIDLKRTNDKNHVLHHLCPTAQGRQRRGSTLIYYFIFDCTFTH